MMVLCTESVLEIHLSVILYGVMILFLVVVNFNGYITALSLF